MKRRVRQKYATESFRLLKGSAKLLPEDGLGAAYRKLFFKVQGYDGCALYSAEYYEILAKAVNREVFRKQRW